LGELDSFNVKKENNIEHYDIGLYETEFKLNKTTLNKGLK
jgi:hypothetical protein